MQAGEDCGLQASPIALIEQQLTRLVGTVIELFQVVDYYHFMKKVLPAILAKQGLKTRAGKRQIGLVKGIAQGEAAVSEGRVLSNSEARERMRHWLK